MTGTHIPGKINLDNISIVLQQPRFPENIGAAARAMRNMGITRLIVVEPEKYHLASIHKMATHVASDIVDRIKIFSNLKEALAPFSYVVGTTARMGRKRQEILTPLQTAEALTTISQNNPVAILFGPEDRGLSNEDIRCCHQLVNIPTAEFSSLNLAQAVMIMCYEIFQAGRKHNGIPPKKSAPRLATRIELDGMYEQLQETLVRIQFINHENPTYWTDKFRNFFSRTSLRASEVRMIRGLCKQIFWYGRKMRHEASEKKEDRRQNSAEN